MEPVKLSPKTLPKTKKVTQYILLFLVTTALIKGSELLGKKEVRLKNIKQLTFSGENAEGYFSLDGNLLIYQAHDGDSLCDQIYTMDLSTRKTKLVSTGLSAGSTGTMDPSMIVALCLIKSPSVLPKFK